MNKLKIRLLILLSVFSFGVLAQKSDIESTFNNYIKATHSEDAREQLDFFHPAYFDYVSRDELLATLELMHNSPMIKVDDEQLISISEVYTEGDKQFARLSYSFNFFIDISDVKGEEGGNMTADEMKEDYIMDHGEENVDFDEESYTFNVRITSQFYMVKSPELQGWKILPDDDEIPEMLEEVIPEGIRAKLQ